MIDRKFGKAAVAAAIVLGSESNAGQEPIPPTASSVAAVPAVPSANATLAEQEAADRVAVTAVRAVRPWAHLDAGPAEIVYVRRLGNVVHVHCRKTWTTKNWLGRPRSWRSDVLFTMVRKPGLRSVIDVGYEDDNPWCSAKLNLVRVLPAVNEQLSRWDKVYGELSAP